MSEVIDNRAHRIRTMKEIVKHLHAGLPPEQVRSRMQELVQQTDSCELVAMEQELIAEGMPVEQIKSMCDLHSQVTRDVLVQLPAKPVQPGHPIDTFQRENEALRETIGKMRAAIAEIRALPAEGSASAQLLRWRQAYNDLMDIDKHYQRKEHTVFSRLELHGIHGPSKVMWAKDDDVRAMLKQLGAALGDRDGKAGRWPQVAEAYAEPALAAVEEMIYKEENILLPMCSQVFTEEDWAEIWASSPKYGWCLVEPREGYRPPQATTPRTVDVPHSGAMMLPTGNLSLDQLVAIFKTLPVDLTFVDADDRVAFFSEGPDRIFARSRAIIGRLVQHCHPPRSVEVVDRILADFREGRESIAEFWIEFHGRFVHIRYFAVRDKENRYMGTLEVTQDVTSIRKLEGERRLLEYGPRPEAAASAAAAAGVPAWLSEAAVRLEVDANELMKAGEHPLGRVREGAAALGPQQAVRLTSTFHPAPLIQAMERDGFAVHSAANETGKHVTYIWRK